MTDPALVAQHFQQVAARPEFYDAHDTGVNPHLEDLLSEWFQRLGKKMGDFKYASRMPAFESLLMSLLVVLSLAILGYIVFRLTRGRMWTWNEAPSLPRAKRRYARLNTTTKRSRMRLPRATGTRRGSRRGASFSPGSSAAGSSRLTAHAPTASISAKLRDQPLPRPALALLTGIVDAYDRFIYGRAAIGETEWNQFHEQIEEAALLLHLDDKRTPAPAQGATA